MSEAKERPILFSGPMVRAILEGRKTQTRRIIKPQPPNNISILVMNPHFGKPSNTRENVPKADYEVNCPYGQPGDRLWLKETCKYYGIEYHAGKTSALVEYKADGVVAKISLDDPPRRNNWTKLTPSIHMPRWASRITLEITNIRVERLQEISHEDALAEGVDKDAPLNDYGTGSIYRDAYVDLWESINGPGSWDLNPWVWVIEFKIKG